MHQKFWNFWVQTVRGPEAPPQASWKAHSWGILSKNPAARLRQAQATQMGHLEILLDSPGWAHSQPPASPPRMGRIIFPAGPGQASHDSNCYLTTSRQDLEGECSSWAQSTHRTMRDKSRCLAVLNDWVWRDLLAIKTKNVHLQEAALGVSGVVTKYNPGLQGHFQILEAQSRSIHLRPEDGKGFLEVAAAQTDKAEGGEVGGGRGRACECFYASLPFTVQHQDAGKSSLYGSNNTTTRWKQKQKGEGRKKKKKLHS